MRVTPYPMATCKVCGAPFRTTRRSRPRAGGSNLTEHCSSRCGHVSSAAKLRGQSMAQASAARSWTCRERFRHALLDQFGMLSDREVALLQAGRHRWYCKGFTAGVRALHKKDTLLLRKDRAA